MIDTALLDQTIATLTTYNGKTKIDPAFDNYKRGIEKAFIGFIHQCKTIPLAQQLDYITKEMKEKTGRMSAEIEKDSNQKRSWTLIFSLAALALERKRDLPQDHPEIAPIDKLLSGLSNGWVNGFGSIGFGITLNNEAIDDILNGLKSWILKYDTDRVELSKHDNILALYSSISALEEKLLGSRLTPSRFKEEMGFIKDHLISKFNELKNRLEVRKNTVPVLNPSKEILSEEDNLYTQFKQELNSLKIQQGQIQQNIDSFPQQHFNRVAKLHQFLENVPLERNQELMSQFWKHYDTPEKFNQLLFDLEIPENEKAGWNEYFKYQYGSYREQVTAILWTGSWGIPQFMGGIPSHTISLELLYKKCDAVLQPLRIIHSKLEKQKLILEAPASSQLINNIEEELKNLAMLKPAKIDFLADEYVNVIKHRSTNTFAKINTDIEELSKELEKQRKMVQSFKSIHEKIQLLKKNMDCSRLEGMFRLYLNAASIKLNQTSQPLPVDLPIALKIATLEHSIIRAQSNVLGLQLSLNQIALAFDHQKSNVIELVSKFIHDKENTWGHILLSIFSSSYKTMFDELKDALNEKTPDECLNKMIGALGITNEPKQEKELSTHFKELKKEALKVLSEDYIEEIPIVKPT
ncbi:hypothetical protein [Legionella sp. PC997]|uniref:hypothetical protein n=1 Tax=Legionella sp. PC997 TaxID=2755562 RepID=UPI0015FC39E3|nr:hypothetical protein [Legionella sp. PC997]QMT60712.1 hypothetical protein HBNCFIEN_02096 [Legionella sp. PC997]